ncbi:hypothetical protein EDB89DRAFT_1952140 [Lactarius sanguifluus]|nr:hypothetical protein EDB89DRAFT_1994363 [Lactarius sanguifluus]KAH9174314.1 hypothetical protein EDB89DRAFT_1952140 [Lactarius sanguifluus]
MDQVQTIAAGSGTFIWVVIVPPLSSSSHWWKRRCHYHLFAISASAVVNPGWLFAFHFLGWPSEGGGTAVLWVGVPLSFPLSF